MLVDSREGIAELMRWAKATGAFLSEAHEDIAKKHGVSTEGVRITRPIPNFGPLPLTPNTSSH